MAKSSEKPVSYIQSLRFVGRGTGLVKNFSGFKKTHHTVPDAVNPATSGFLAKLCAEELRDEAEQFFQRARVLFRYKRKDLGLDLSSPTAVLSSPDFTVEISYALADDDPASYVLTRSLQGLRDGEVAATQACTDLCAGSFDELTFVLTRGARVEAVIDAVESLDGEDGLAVDYPSDCRHCILSVPGVSATVRFEGAELSMKFPKNGSPAELLAAFAAVRKAFVLSKEPILAGLL